MEKHILEKIEKHRSCDYRLNRLYEKHLELEASVARMVKAEGLSAEEQKTLKDLKKKKLAGKEELLQVLEMLEN